MIFRPNTFRLKINLKNILWFIKTISYFVLLRSLNDDDDDDDDHDHDDDDNLFKVDD